MPAALQIFTPARFPMVRTGDALAPMILQALHDDGVAPRAGDVIVLAQKIVSKAEGRQMRLADVNPSARAYDLAEVCDRDARIVELILRESAAIVRATKSVIVVEHRLGFVMANAGVDQSNIPDGDDSALLLPLDPDASAAHLRDELANLGGIDVAVLIIDSFGRAWRNGVTGVAIGAAGLPALLDLRGEPDLFGRPLRSSELALADEVAAAASLTMGQAGEGRPLALLRGVPYPRREGRAADLLRDRAHDLFR